MSEYLMRLTDIGRAKDANSLLVGEPPLTITHIAVGDGEALPDYSANALQNEVWRGAVESISKLTEDSQIVIIEGTIPADVGDFFIHELGLFDSDGDMVGLVKTASTERLDPAQGQLQEQLLRVQVESVNADNVQVLIDPTIIKASRAYVDTQINLVKNLPAMSIIGQICRG